MKWVPLMNLIQLCLFLLLGKGDNDSLLHAPSVITIETNIDVRVVNFIDMAFMSIQNHCFCITFFVGIEFEVDNPVITPYHIDGPFGNHLGRQSPFVVLVKLFDVVNDNL